MTAPSQASSLVVGLFPESLLKSLASSSPETLVPSKCDLKAPFCISGWVYSFRPISDRGIKDCPLVMEFQAWLSRWRRYFGGQKFVPVFRNHSASASELETQPSWKRLRSPPALGPVWESCPALLLPQAFFLIVRECGRLPLICVHRAFPLNDDLVSI